MIATIKAVEYGISGSYKQSCYTHELSGCVEHNSKSGPDTYLNDDEEVEFSVFLQ